MLHTPASLSSKFSQEYIDFGLSMEYHANVSPSAAMTKDLARDVLFPPVDAIATKEAYHKLTWVGLAILHG